MSITDELREYALGWDERNRVRRDLRAIADRIDAEHEKAVHERRRSCVYYDPERHYCSCHDIDVSGYVELPKDADGEYIHIGDKLIDEDDKLQKPAIVKCILYNDEGCVVSDIDPRGCWYDSSLLRHHHAPTVEDVLREMLDAWGELPSNATNEAIIAEYAAKLRLAKEVDA